MKVSLVNVCDVPPGGVVPNMALLHLAAYIRERLPFHAETRIHEGGQTVDSILDFGPDVVGFTCLTPLIDRTLQAARQLKKRSSAFLMIGGLHISGIPQSLDPVFDAAVLDEGEETLAELLSHIHEGRGRSQLRDIDGVAFYEKDQLIITQRRQAIRDLDSLPLPAYDLVCPPHGFEPTFFFNGGFKVTLHMMTSRGCPHNCTYCVSSSRWGKVRWHSAEKIIENIEFLVNRFGATRILVADDYFTWPPKRFRKVHRYLIDSGLNKRLSFRCFSRCDLVSEETAAMLKEINCEVLCFGIDFGSQRNLDHTRKKARVEDNLRGLDICRRAGLDTASGFIIGIPGETDADLRATYEFIKKSSLDTPDVYKLEPFPGTPICDEIRTTGTEEQKQRLLKYGEFHRSMMESATLGNLFLFPHRVKVANIWTNIRLPQERYRYWVIRIFKLILLKRSKYFIRTLVRNFSLRYIARLLSPRALRIIRRSYFTK